MRKIASLATSAASAALITLSTLVGFVGTAPPAHASPSAAVAAPGVVAQVEMTPSKDGMPGAALMQKVLNWFGQFGLWAALASILIGGGIWGISQHFGNGYQAGKGKILTAAGAIGAVIIGLGPTIINSLYTAAKG